MIDNPSIMSKYDGIIELAPYQTFDSASLHCRYAATSVKSVNSNWELDISGMNSREWRTVSLALIIGMTNALCGRQETGIVTVRICSTLVGM
jgi:hypothetical protein